MRPATGLARCTSSHLILFDFLAPRLHATSKPRIFHANASRSFRRTISTRHLSVGATARTTKTKASILDATPECDLSYHADQMHKCALDEDILGVWAAYNHIRDKHPRLVLGPQHYGATSLMLVKLFADTISSENRSEAEMHAVEELAFACAGAGYVEGFRQMLLWLLAKRDTGRIIEVYERLERTVLVLDESGLKRGGDSLELTTNEEGSLHEGEDQTLPRLENPDISRLDVANIMVITIAAYAFENRFNDALQFMVRQKSSRVTGDMVKDLQRQLKRCGNSTEEAKDLMDKTRKYIEVGSTARLVHTPEVFKAHIRNLLKSKKPVYQLEKVRRKLKNGFTGQFPWADVDGSQQSSPRPVIISEKIWAYLIHAYIIRRKEQLAQELWADVIRFGRNPSIHMWNALLEGYRDTQQAEKLLNAWDVMKKEGVSYDVRSYGAKLGCLSQESFVTRQYMMKLFDEFKQTKPSNEDSLFVYNTVLNGLLARKDMQDAVTILEGMKAHGPQPDIVSYNTFIAFHAHAKAPNLRGIADVVRELTKAGVEPDVFTFTTILTALLKARVPSGPKSLLSIMNEMGVRQNVATYSAIIEAQVREGTRSGVTAAWQLLQQMERMKDVNPNIVTYTSFLAGVHRSQELDKALITSIQSDIVQKMKKRGMQPKLGTYHILFKACLTNPNPEALDFFIDYYNMMRSDEIATWHDTWYIILDGLIRREAWKLASEMKNQMLESGFQPMWGVEEKVKRVEIWEQQNRPDLDII